MTHMSDWYLYLIRCRDASLYTGITTDVEKRFETHCQGKGAKYLRGRGPIQLAYSVHIGEHSLAARLEYRVKQLDRRQKEALIRNTIRITDLIKADTENNQR